MFTDTVLVTLLFQHSNRPELDTNFTAGIFVDPIKPYCPLVSGHLSGPNIPVDHSNQLCFLLVPFPLHTVFLSNRHSLNNSDITLYSFIKYHLSYITLSNSSINNSILLLIFHKPNIKSIVNPTLQFTFNQRPSELFQQLISIKIFQQFLIVAPQQTDLLHSTRFHKRFNKWKYNPSEKPIHIQNIHLMNPSKKVAF